MSFTVHVKQGPNKWDITVEASETVAAFKKQIAEASSIPAENQRLIYSGKILKDDQTLESYKVQEDHVIHLVKSGMNKSNESKPAAATATAASNTNGTEVPANINAGQQAGFNPLNDLTGARYAGYLNMPSSDMFGPDGGMNQAAPNEDEMLRMMENPIFQSQMNEMLSNPQMIDFIIQSNPQLQAMGPQARQMFQSPMFRQMLTNPEMLRQSMQMASMMGMGPSGAGAGAPGANSGFPAPGGDDNTTSTSADPSTATTEPATTTTTNSTPQTNNTTTPQQNPFAALLNPAMNPFAAAGATGANPTTGANPNMPNFAQFLESMMPLQQTQAQTPQPEDTRPPEERYEHQLRQLNDMGFFDFDRNVAALRRSGGSVQGAVDALLNGSV